jgi:hypothetical protein
MPLVSLMVVSIPRRYISSVRRWNSDVDREVELQADWEGESTGFRLFVMLTDGRNEARDMRSHRLKHPFISIHYLHVTSVFILCRRSGRPFPTWNRCAQGLKINLLLQKRGNWIDQVTIRSAGYYYHQLRYSRQYPDLV